jgi:hypothetical protein
MRLLRLKIILYSLLFLFFFTIPYYDAPYLLMLHIMLCINLLVHWIEKSDKCSVSLLEGKIRGVHYTNGYSHEIVSPIFKLNETRWFLIFLLLTMYLMFISINRLRTNTRWSESIQCYKNLISDVNYKELPIPQQVLETANCFRGLVI